jgi:hypothetical protein
MSRTCLERGHDLQCVGGAKRRIEGTGEGLLAHAEGLLIVELGTTGLGLGAAGKSRRSVRSLVVAVRADDNSFKSVLVLANIGGRRALDVLSPDAALELSDGGSLATALLRVELGITLNEDVEASAGVGGVAVSRASTRIVGCEKLVSKVTASFYRATEVRESLDITRRCLRQLGKRGVDSAALEGIDRVRNCKRSVGVGLCSTRIEGVDEATVSAHFNGSRACSSRSESPGVCPAYRRTRRRSDVGRIRVEGPCSRGRRSHGSRRGSRSGSRRRSRLDTRLRGAPDPPTGLEAPLCCLLCNSSTSHGGGSSGLCCVLVVRSDSSLTRTNRRSLGEGDWDGIKGVDIKGLRGWRSRDKGSSPDEKE